MAKTILTIRNHHVKDCGEPPALDEKGTAGVGKRTCYFTNEHGEQFFMQFDPADKNGEIRMWAGDVGWEENLIVKARGGHVRVKFVDKPGFVILTREELAIVSAFWWLYQKTMAFYCSCPTVDQA